MAGRRRLRRISRAGRWLPGRKSAKPRGRCENAAGGPCCGFGRPARPPAWPPPASAEPAEGAGRGGLPRGWPRACMLLPVTDGRGGGIRGLPCPGGTRPGADRPWTSRLTLPPRTPGPRPGRAGAGVTTMFRSHDARPRGTLAGIVGERLASLHVRGRRRPARVAEIFLPCPGRGREESGGAPHAEQRRFRRARPGRNRERPGGRGPAGAGR